jgi:nucleoside-diphosphate-sugar epimerase
VKKKLLIVGLGHLAKFICDEEDANSYNIFGTYRDLKKVESFNVTKYHFDTSDSRTIDNLPLDMDVVIFNMPMIDGYSQLIQELDKRFTTQTSFVFISSTSVYGVGQITESSKQLGVSRNSASLIELESLIKSNPKREYLIIRPGGLIDSQRNPANFLSKKEIILEANQLINLVHTQDVARFIWHCLEANIWNEEFNLVSDNHSTKKAFYSGEISRLNLRQPKWMDSNITERIISNSKAKSSGFQFLWAKLCIK